MAQKSDKILHLVEKSDKKIVALCAEMVYNYNTNIYAVNYAISQKSPLTVRYIYGSF